MTETAPTPLRRVVRIINPMGLHMRPAGTFAAVAGGLVADVVVWNGEKRANGKSLWDLIGLCACRGTELIVEANGPDAAVGIDKLADILAAPGDPD